MNAPLDSKFGKQFDYLAREAAIYKAWEDAGIFRPEGSKSIGTRL